MSRADDPRALAAHLARALEELNGAVLVLDAKLRIVAFTPAVADVLGATPRLGVNAPKMLCGHARDRPVAEALATGRSVSAEVSRPDGRGDARPVRVRADPFGEGERAMWVLRLTLPSPAVDDAETFGLITRDASMLQLLRSVRKVARTEATVLVRGETGSGKELLARAIHDASPRHAGPFRAINCAALPPNLLESELFGHARGAFTGAVADAPGHFRLAHEGTIFLDEVAELPLDVQAKLLRVLQERTVVPVGARDSVEVDVRIVSATHRALRKEVEAGRFRADLLYRLRVVPLFLPTLRERPDDVELLAAHFLARHAEGGGRAITHITAGALAAMRSYPWPGNVRELENAIEYATIMGEGAALSASDLPPEVRGEEPGTARASRAEPEDTEPSDRELPVEARRLLHALERSAGHMGRAAQTLGISRTTLWRRLKRHGIDRS